MCVCFWFSELKIYTQYKINKSSFDHPYQFTAIGTAKTIRETVTYLCDLIFFVAV